MDAELMKQSGMEVVDVDCFLVVFGGMGRDGSAVDGRDAGAVGLR